MTINSIQIDANKCQRDAICVSVCPVGIFRGNVGELPQIDENLAAACIRCGHCSAACPTAAITIDGLAEQEYRSFPTKLAELEMLSALITSRRSIREFRDELVPLGQIEKLLDITRFCPTAKNTQLMHWTLINGKEKVREVSAAVIDTFRSNEKMAAMVAAFDNGLDPVNRKAPQLLLVSAPAKYVWGPLDAAIYIANFELLAHAAGYGTCWAGFTTTAAQQGTLVNAKIGLPEGEKVYGAVMLGLPKYKYQQVPPRKPLSLKVI